MFATLLLGVVVPETHRSYRELKRKKFCVVGVYTQDLEKPQNCQNQGVGACLEMGTCPGPSEPTCMGLLHESFKEYSSLSLGHTCMSGGLGTRVVVGAWLVGLEVGGGWGGMTAIGHFNA